MWEIIDVGDVVGEFGEVGSIVYSTFTKFVIRFEDFRSDVFGEDGFDKSDIFVIGDPPSVVDFGS